MKKRNIALAALAFMIASGAYAGNLGIGNTYNQPQGGKAEASAGAVAGAAAINKVSVSTAVSNKQAQGQIQGQQQGQQQQATSSSGGNTLQGGDVTVEAARNPVSTAYAAPLTASNGTCMGSTSVGGQGVTIGLSLGTTWTDSSCDLRYDAEALRAAGQPAAATARLCQKPEIAAAMEAAGTPCPGAKKAAAAAPAATQQADASQPAYQDPIIRRRLGLPPL